MEKKSKKLNQIERVMRENKLFKLPDQFQRFSNLKSVLPTKREINICESYGKLRSQREEFRMHLLNLLQEEGSTNEGNKYEYYIRHGVDMVHITPIDDNWIRNILHLVPDKLKKRKRLLDILLMQVKDQYLDSVKKAVVDVTLGDVKYPASRKVATVSSNDFNKNKTSVSVSLQISHPVVVKIRDVWHRNYSQMLFLGEENMKIGRVITLSEFRENISNQSLNCKKLLNDEWHQTVLQITKKNRKSYTKVEKDKLYATIYTLMTLQMQSLLYSSVKRYNNFMCASKKRYGFEIEIVYTNNRLQLHPQYAEFDNTFLDIFNSIVSIITHAPRVTSSPLHLLNPCIIDDLYTECMTQVRTMFEDHWICVLLKMQDFDDYLPLINGQAFHRLNDFLSKSQEFERYESEVSYYHKLMEELTTCLSYVISIGIFEIHRHNFISVLKETAKNIRNKLLQKVENDCQISCTKLNEDFRRITENVLKPAENTKELVRLKYYSLELGTKTFFEMEQQLREIMRYILFLSDYNPLTSLQIKQNCMTFLLYKRIPAILDKSREIIHEKTEQFQILLKKRIEDFNNRLDLYMKEVDEFQTYRNVKELSKYLKKSQSLSKKLKIALQQIHEFNEEEIAFGWIKTIYPKRDQIVEKLKPYKKLYENCTEYRKKYETWSVSKVGTFDPESINEQVEQFHENVVQLSKDFSSIPAPYNLTNNIRLDIETFQGQMLIVKTLGNPGLKERHWDKISEIVGFPIRPSDELTLAKILDLGLEEYVNKFQMISDSATKENDLENRLTSMMSEWNDVKFNIMPYNDESTFILKPAEDIQSLLDDHIVKTQLMNSSPYIKPFEQIISDWEGKLIYLQEILDAWFRVQKIWIYFESIFTVFEIQQNIPEESRRFSAVDKVWKDIMKSVSLNCSVLVVIQLEKLLERLNKCNSLLDMIQRGLNDYLHIKRSIFPRFYMLANEEVIDIISNTKDPSLTQKYLSKCFEGISGLVFTQDMKITAITSVQETVKLIKEVDTTLAKGQVEKWLMELEIQMKETLRKGIVEGKNGYNSKDKLKWIYKHPQQVVLVILNLVWASDVDLNFKKLQSLTKVSNSSIKKISDILCEPIEPLRRNTLGLVLSMEIHNRDVVQTLMEEKIECEKEFLWKSHLQYKLQDGNLFLNMADCKIEYGYEYLGNVTKLVITPQVDTIYRTIFVNLKYSFGTSLEGLTGAGKTEIIRDISKAVGKHCVIFNCTKYLKANIVHRFFQGAIASGCWICFDDADRIDINTLSVIASNMINIKQASISSMTRVNINSIAIPVNQSCAIFATATNSIFQPSNFNTFFRGIRLHCDYNLEICQVKLLTLGFKNSSLAGKIVSLFKLSSELLSTNFRNSYNMRIIGRVIDTAGILKCNFNSEDDAMLMAIMKTYTCNLDQKDVCIFRDLVKNIFSKDLPMRQNDDDLNHYIKKACVELNLQWNGSLENKIKEMYENMKERTGVIIVGKAASGKSTTLKILQNVLSYMNIEVILHVINPGSLTYEQLYGHEDGHSHQWLDGIFSGHYRKLSKDPIDSRKWLILDGPMESTWMENLNSILDESKKLCLNSGERMNLPLNMNLIFETDCISHISPSTATHCGIVYVDNIIDWQHLITPWLKTLPKFVSQSHQNLLLQMFERFIPPLLQFLKNVSNKEMFKWNECGLLQSLFNIFDCFLVHFKEEDVSNNEIDTRAQLEGVFFFSCIWSFGGWLSESNKEQFSTLFRAFLQKSFPTDVKIQFGLSDDMCQCPQKSYIYVIPDSLTVFDYQFIKEGKGKWKLWSENSVFSSGIARDIAFNEIIVPTVSNVRNDLLMSFLIENGKPILFIGPAASGKTTDVINYLKRKLDKKLYKSVFIQFTRLTTAEMLQRTIMSKLERRKKGTYGSPLGCKYVIFIDDLKTSSDISAIELLRQWLQYRYWYNYNATTPLKIVDIQFICALTQDNETVKISQRFTRYFNVISTSAFNNRTTNSIFSKIMLWHLDTRGFSKEFDPCIEQIIKSTIEMHKLCVQFLLPVPSKSKAHYVFNLRYIARVIQGIVQSVPEAIEDLITMKRLCIHEIMRVYQDTLMDFDDRDWFISSLCNISSQYLKEELSDMFKYLLDQHHNQVDEYVLKKVLFCDFTNPKADIKNYAQVDDVESLYSITDRYLEEHNNMSKKPMDLILFRYSIEYLSRISRIIKQPRGHAVLTGMIGTGRQSLARLAVHVSEYELFQIEVRANYGRKDWINDIKHLLLSAYTDQHAAFLLTDSQMVEEYMIDDVCQLLTMFDIPNIFTVEEKHEICEKMEVIDSQRDKTLQTNGSHEELLNLFLDRIQKQIHVILVFDSQGNKFQKYFRIFPVISKYCTVCHFQNWNKNSLIEVTGNVLKNMHLTDVQKSSTLEMLLLIYATIERITKVTCKSYVKLITNFRNIYNNKERELDKEKRRRECGIRQLINAKDMVKMLSRECEGIEPTIEHSKMQFEKAQKSVEAEREIETEAEVAVNAARTTLNMCQKKLTSVKMDHEKKIKTVESNWNNAVEMLKSLNNNEWNSLKTIKTPPKPVKLVIEALAIIKEIKAEKQSEGKGAGGKVIEDYYKPTLKSLNDVKFIESLTTYDKENVPSRIIRILEEKYLSNEDFEEEKIKSISPAGAAIRKWISGIYEYDRVIAVDSPSKLMIDKLIEEMEIAKSKVEEKERELDLIQENRKLLEEDLEKQKEQVESLEMKQNTFLKKRQSAVEMVEKLGGKQTEWLSRIQRLEDESNETLGNSLISAGMITYLGPMELEVRFEIVNDWMDKLRNTGIRYSVDFKLSSIITCNDDDSLYFTDPYLMDNVAIMRGSNRWCLFIDPDEIMKNYITHSEKENNLKIIRLQETGYLRTLENAITAGNPVLLENVAEYLDPILYPLFDKQIMKSVNGTFSVKLGDAIVEYNQSFRFYITSKLKKPTYSLEIMDKVIIVNCNLTNGTIMELIRQSLMSKDEQVEKTQQTDQIALCTSVIKKTEESILDLLSEGDNIIDVEGGVNKLTTMVSIINDNTNKLESLEYGKNEFDLLTQQLASVYHVINSLNNLNACYEYSFSWYSKQLQLFMDAIKMEQIIQKFVKNLYQSISCGISYTDSKILGLLLATEIDEKMITLQNINNDIVIGFKERKEDFKTQKEDLCELKNQILSLKDELTNPFQIGKLESQLDTYVTSALDKNCCNKTVLDMTWAFNQSTPSSPIVLLAKGDSNPMLDILQLSSQLGFDGEKCKLLTLVDSDVIQMDEENSANTIIENYMKSGGWVVLINLQNSTESYYYEIEKICEKMPSSNIHPDFRLWLLIDTSLHCPSIITRLSLKIMYDNCTSFRISMQKLYLNESLCSMLKVEQVEMVSNLKFMICVCDAILHERFEFENHKYDNNDDTNIYITLAQLLNFNHNMIPYTNLEEMIGKCYYRYYGWKYKCLISYFHLYCVPSSNDTVARLTEIKEGKDQLTIISNLSDEIVQRLLQINCKIFLKNHRILIWKILHKFMLTKQEKLVLNNKNKEYDYDSIKKIMNSILEVISFESYYYDSIIYSKEPLQMFINQQMENFINLCRKIENDISHLTSVIKGNSQLSEEDEYMLWSLSGNHVPKQWFPIKISISQFINYVKKASTFYKTGSNHTFYPLDVFICKREFLSAVLFNESISTNIPVSELRLEFQPAEFENKPEKGILISDLWVENGKWNTNSNQLEEIENLEDVSKFPMIWCYGVGKEDAKVSKNEYECPVYDVIDENEPIFTIFLKSYFSNEQSIIRNIKLITKFEQ